MNVSHRQRVRGVGRRLSTAAGAAFSIVVLPPTLHAGEIVARSPHPDTAAARSHQRQQQECSDQRYQQRSATAQPFRKEDEHL